MEGKEGTEHQTKVKEVAQEIEARGLQPETEHILDDIQKAEGKRPEFHPYNK